MRVLVVGGGAAGVSAAMQARELGVDVVLLEAAEVGGTSLNHGPAPVRTLARAARLARDWNSWADFGLEGNRPVPNLPAVLANSARVSRYARDRKHMSARLRHFGIELTENLGPVQFLDSTTMAAGDGRTWTADRIILAVGGHAASLPVPGGELALTYSDLPTLTALPGTAAVIGGADTGCQIASILADLGSRVSLFEAGPHLLPHADTSVSTGMRDAFRSRGIEVFAATPVQSLEGAGGRVRLRHQDTETPFDAVFAAIGWPADIQHLGLPRAGVTAEPHAIPVDAHLRTNVEHIYAVGDANGRSKLVQTARLEGRVAAKNAVNGPTAVATYTVVPTGSFTDPEYGQVGLTEAQAVDRHRAVTATALYENLLRPVTDGRPEGFCKLIADADRHTILGAHVLGEYSAEIVQVVATAMASGMKVEQLADLQFSFPTFTEAVAMAAQKICRDIGIGSFPAVWSDLESEG